MAKFRLGPGGIKLIEEEIDKIFDSAKVRFLGPHTVPKRIRVTYDRPKALAGVYESAVTDSLSKPDKDVLKSLIQIADNYIEAARQRAKAQIVTSIQAALTEIEANNGAAQDVIRNTLKVKVDDALRTTSSQVKQIVEAETNKAKNIGVWDSIVESNKALKVDDPVVYFAVIHDELLCKECKKIHLMPNGVTPRLWYLSEVSHGYHARGEDFPSVHGLHPSCRCTIITLTPGYGFKEGTGETRFVDFGHSEIEKQRGGSDGSD